MPIPDAELRAAYGRPAPDRVRQIAAGRRIEPVWLNEIGGLTYAIDGGAEYVKVGPAHAEFRPDAEAARLDWLTAKRLPVPELLGYGTDGDQVWFHTRGLPGRNAIEVQADPQGTVAALGRGLRRFHDSLDAEHCPFDFSVQERCQRRGLDGFTDRVPPLDLVVCHGDACNPNFLIQTRDGRPEVTGYVDLGLCGVADRWADLVMAIGSLRWNFPGVEAQVLLDGYGIELDPDKAAFYTELWRAD